MSCGHEVRFTIKPTDDACRFHFDVRAYKDRIVAPDEYTGATEVTPSDSEQVLPTTDKLVRDDITVLPAPTEYLSTDHNGTFTPSDGKVGFYQVDVDVNPDLRPLSVSENGSYQPEGFDGYSEVSVDVPSRGYDIPKIDDGNAHIWIDVPDKFRNMTVYCNLRGTAIVSVDWGDGTEEETYYGRNGVGTLNHNYASSGFYHIVMKTIQEPANAYQKALGGTGNRWLLGGGDFPERTRQYCLVGFESGNWYIQGGQLLMSSMCVAAYYKRATGYAYASYLYGIQYMRIFELPDIVTIIPDNFFENDRCISDFVIPERITRIGKNVFSGTANINIHIERITPPTLDGTLGTKCTPTIYVPAESLEAYKTATNWSNYADSIFGEPTT